MFYETASNVDISFHSKSMIKGILYNKDQTVISDTVFKRHRCSSSAAPEHADQGGDASGLEDGEQALSLVGQVVEDAGCGACGFHVACVLHGPHHCRHHLRGLHQGAARGLFTCQLVDDLCCLADHHLMRDGRKEAVSGGNQ